MRFIGGVGGGFCIKDEWLGGVLALGRFIEMIGGVYLGGAIISGVNT